MDSFTIGVVRIDSRVCSVSAWGWDANWV